MVRKQKYLKKYKRGFKKFLTHKFIILALLPLTFLIVFFLSTYNNKTRKAGAQVNVNQGGFFFGSNVHPDLLSSQQMDAVLLASNRANFNMLRGGDIFSNISPTEDPNTWLWEKQDMWVDKTIASGIEPMLVVAYGAPWLAANLLDPNETMENKNIFIKAFGDYAYRTALRYKGKVKYYNIWNEPSLPQFFGWGADEFARLFAEASYRIKEADPDALTAFDVHAIDHMYSYNYSAEHQAGSTFMPRVLNKSVTLQYNGQTINVIDYVDILMGHSYPDRTWDIPEDILSQRKEIKTPFSDLDAYLTHTYQPITGQRYGYGPIRGKKRYMLTENGWYACPNGSTPGNYVTEQKQAALIVRTLLNVLSSPIIEGYLQYDMKDDGKATSCINTNGESEYFYGLTRYDLLPNGELNPKPSYIAYRVVIETLNGTNFVSQTNTAIDSSKKIINYMFRSADGKKTVWALVRANASNPLKGLDPTTSPLTLSVSGDMLQFITMNGDSQIMYPTNGKITVNVSENPILIVQNLDGTIPTPTPTSAIITPTPTPTVNYTLTPTPTPTPSSQVSFIEIKSPANGAILTGSISISAGPISSYINNMQKIKIYVDGNLLKDCNYPTNQCSGWWNPTPGTHQIWATGYDRANPANFTTSEPIIVTR